MQIFVDMDGVLTNFELAYYNTFGHWAKEQPSKNEFWRLVDSVPDFYYHLPLMDGAVEFFQDIEWLNPFVLTACSTKNFVNCANDKRRVIRENFSKNAFFIPMISGENKFCYMHNKGDILIDDYGRNCDAWEKAGGLAIQHDGNFNRTRNMLELLLSRKVQRRLG